MPKKLHKRLVTALKFIVSAALIYLIFTKIDLHNVVETLKTISPHYFLTGTVLVLISKVLASFRLNMYFHQIGVKITPWSNLKLYFLGMFYNLFLPGGVGGDAYKGYMIQKKFRAGTKRVVAVLLLDRLSGMLLIFVFSCIIALFLKNRFFGSVELLFILGIPFGTMAFWFLNKTFFGYVLPVFWRSFAYSALVQLFQLMAVLFILNSFSVTVPTLEYLLVFLVSSIVSVIPLTIGGIGSREVTFLYGAQWLELATDTSIGISFVFFLMTALISFLGIVYHFQKPTLKTIDP